MIFKIWSIRKYVLIFIAMFFASLDGIIIASVFKYLIEIMQGGHKGQIIPLVILSITVYLFVVLANYIYSLLKNSLVKDFNNTAKKAVLENYIASPKILDKSRSSETLSFLLNDIKFLEENYTKPFFDIFLYSFYALTSLAYTLWIDSKLAIIFLLFSLVPSIYPFLMKKGFNERTEQWTNTTQNYTEKAEEVIRAVTLIKSFQVSNLFLKRTSQADEKMENSLKSLSDYQALSVLLIGFTSILCYIFPVGIGTYFVMSGQSTMANLIAVFLASDRIITPVKFAIKIYNDFAKTSKIRSRLAEMTKDPIKTLDYSFPSYNRILLKDVRIQFEEHLILDHVNAEISENDRILFIGDSGSGKSTLFLALLGSILPSAGEVIYEKDPNKENSYQSIIYVPQEDHVFEGSLKFNLLIDRSEKGADKLERTFKIDGSFPEQIAFEGKNLSGGMAKRISLVRSFIFKKGLLLLDEPFQGLENSLQSVIEKYILQNSFVVVASHIIHPENLHLYNKFWVIKDHQLLTYDSAESFLKNNPIE